MCSPALSSCCRALLRARAWLRTWPLGGLALLRGDARATAVDGCGVLARVVAAAKGARPRSVYPISVANIKKAERNIFRGNQSDLKEFWQRRAWEPSGGKSRRESERTVAAD